MAPSGSRRQRGVMAAWLALAGLAILPGGAPLRAEGDAAALAQCRAAIAGRVSAGDAACLRRVYRQPRSQWPAPQVDAAVAWQELAPLPAQLPFPADNPATPQKIALGRRLFDDPRLSRSAQIACANCHDRQLGWSDGRSVSFGHDRQPGRRNALSVATSAFSSPLFWDGRAATLEEQALHPIADAREMAFTAAAAARRLQRAGDYDRDFAAVFGDSRITPQRMAHALAAFQRSLVPRNSRFDRFLHGQQAALSDMQLWGLHLFRTRGRCMNCHFGAALTDNRFHNLGLHFYGRARQDLGRYEITGNPADSGTFRTPSLRGVARSGPWMHNGLFPELRGVVNAYNAGMPRPRPPAGAGHDPPFPQPDPLLKPLHLNREEIEAITAFLQTL